MLDRASRFIDLNADAAQHAPPLRKNELAQFALRSPEISRLRKVIDNIEPFAHIRPHSSRRLPGTDMTLFVRRFAESMHKCMPMTCQDKTSCAESRRCAPTSSPMPAMNCDALVRSLASSISAGAGLGRRQSVIAFRRLAAQILGLLADRCNGAGNEGARSARVPVRPALCGLDRADPERSFHRRQDPAWQDHSRRRRDVAQRAGGGSDRRDQAGEIRPRSSVALSPC